MGRRRAGRLHLLPDPHAHPPPRLGPRAALAAHLGHLSLNHLSLSRTAGADALREVLRLYDLTDSSETRNQIEGVLGVKHRRVVSTIQGDGPLAFRRGAEVTVQFDEERFTGSGLFLFASAGALHGALLARSIRSPRWSPPP
ncbi:MAG: type VI secretion system baseplate subunit TssF [Isosphaeraceae bacterium]